MPYMKPFRAYITTVLHFRSSSDSYAQRGVEKFVDIVDVVDVRRWCWS